MSYPFAGRYFDKYKPFFPYELGDYSFKVDLQFGELLFNKKLISFSGRHLPLDLSLKNVQRHDDIFLDAPDKDHGKFSIIMNEFWWFY